jgi:hypothetical protein
MRAPETHIGALPTFALAIPEAPSGVPIAAGAKAVEWQVIDTNPLAGQIKRRQVRPDLNGP